MSRVTNHRDGQEDIREAFGGVLARATRRTQRPARHGRGAAGAPRREGRRGDARRQARGGLTKRRPTREAASRAMQPASASRPERACRAAERRRSLLAQSNSGALRTRHRCLAWEAAVDAQPTRTRTSSGSEASLVQRAASERETERAPAERGSRLAYGEPDETMTAVNAARPTMDGESLWPRLAGLPLVIEACEYERLHAVLAYEFERITTHVRLVGAGAHGVGEDGSGFREGGTAPHETRPSLHLEGEWT